MKFKVKFIPSDKRTPYHVFMKNVFRWVSIHKTHRADWAIDTMKCRRRDDIAIKKANKGTK